MKTGPQREMCFFYWLCWFDLICLGAEDVSWEAPSDDVENKAAQSLPETENEEDSSGEAVKYT